MSNDKLAALRIALEDLDSTETLGPTTEAVIAAAQNWYLSNANEAEKQAGPVALGYMNAGHLHEMQQGRLPYGYVYAEEGPGAHVAVFLAPPSESDKEDAELTDEQIDAAALAETGFDGVGTQEMNAFDIRRIVRAARAKKEPQ